MTEEEIKTNYLREFLIRYETATTWLPIAFIPFDWAQDELADYFAWKVERKLKRVVKMDNWLNGVVAEEKVK